MSKHRIYPYRCLKQQDGMALVSALMILAAVSLMAVGMSGDASTEPKISGNKKQHQQAFNLADGGADIGVHALLDHIYYEVVDPSNDYPQSGDIIPLVPGYINMKYFGIDQDLEADIYGYDDSDNLSDPANGYPDISFELVATDSQLPFKDSTVHIDIDRLREKILAGSSIAFAAGYEGVGQGAAGGSVAVFYGVRAEAFPTDSASASASSEIAVVYRKVSNVLGGSD